MKQFLKVLAKVIAIPCGCLCLLVVLAFLLLMNLFKASPSDIQKGNESLKQIFISLDMPPKKVESNGRYQFEVEAYIFMLLSQMRSSIATPS